MAKVVCHKAAGLTAKGKLKPGYKWAKRRKACPIPARKKRVTSGGLTRGRVFAGSRRKRRRARK